jgi:quinoprotein glucose dehydrogenase
MKLICFLLALTAPAWAQEWPAYGNDGGGSRYSPIAQINRSNVAQLQVAWTYHTHALEPETALNRKAAFEATPIMVNGMLYISTPFNQVIALHAGTGEELWKYDPQVDRSKNYSEVTSRGVASWRDSKPVPADTAAGLCRQRIFLATIDARLIALDGETGKPCADFGQKGIIDLTIGIGLKDAGQYQETSPPAIIRDLVIVGSSIGDNRRADLEKGTVRAYNARTGKLEWIWEPIPIDKPTGAANAWSMISVDAARNLVFVPTGSASPDYYGARRPGNNANANSVVALDAPTGQIIWRFQVVHHDLWDYDVASQPALVGVRRGGQETAAVAINTKMGNLFLLDRNTGAPLFPINERNVPRSDVPGEESAPTQPYSDIPPLVPQSLRASEAWGITPDEKAACKDRIENLRSEGLFTPPSIRGSVQFPGNVGGVNWGSSAYDPSRHLLVVPTNRLAAMVRLIPREKYDEERKSAKDNRMTGEFGAQAGTAFGMYREFLRSPLGLPCNAPPWGALTAVDLETGKKKWEVPLGVTKLPDGKSIPGGLNLGGPLVTAGGLVFIAATVGEEVLRAFDIDTGKVLWEGALPASAQATPMSYRVGEKAVQFIIICAGGHGKAGNKQGDLVIAFALP